LCSYHLFGLDYAAVGVEHLAIDPEPSGPARKETAAAISCGVPKRSSGTSSATSSGLVTKTRLPSNSFTSGDAVLGPQPHVVRHPKELIQEAKNRRRRDNRLLYYNDIVLEWITNHVLASVILFDIALIVPLLTLNAPDTVKITLGVISGSWIQWWALPALQRSQNKTQAQNAAKAAVDHETLTYLAKLQDEQMTELKGIAEILRNLKNK
jgi:hypothetical protein